MTIRRMRIACSIPKATNTHSVLFHCDNARLGTSRSFATFLTASLVSAVNIVLLLSKLLVATVRELFCSVHFARYELVACTTTLALHPAGGLTMLAVASHFNRRRRGPHINSWSPREFSSIYSLSVSPFVPSLYADAPRSHPALALLVA